MARSEPLKCSPHSCRRLSAIDLIHAGREVANKNSNNRPMWTRFLTHKTVPKNVGSDAGDGLRLNRPPAPSSNDSEAGL